MNKKGFTLIELLAVIVILAVLALIITPVITNIISSAKEGAFKSSAYGIADAAKNYCASSMLQNGGELTDSVRFTVSNGELVASNGDKLEVKGKMPIGDSWVNITTNCGVSLSVTDGNYYATKDTDETTVTLSTVENGALTRDELTEKINTLTSELEQFKTDTNNSFNTTSSQISDLQDSVSSYETKMDSIGTVYTNFTRNTTVALGNGAHTTVCSISLDPGKYLLYGFIVSNVGSNTNSINCTFQGSDYDNWTQADYSTDVYRYCRNEAYVNVTEKKTINLTMWNGYANDIAIDCNINAMKIK